MSISLWYFLECLLLRKDFDTGWMRGILLPGAHPPRFIDVYCLFVSDILLPDAYVYLDY